MKTRRYLLLIPVFCLVFFLQVSAQEMKVVRDLQLWTGAEVEKSFGKDWTTMPGWVFLKKLRGRRRTWR